MKRLQLRALPIHGDDCVFVPTARAFAPGEPILLAWRRNDWPRAVVVVASVMATQSAGDRPPRRAGIWLYLPPPSREAAKAFAGALAAGVRATHRRHERLPLALRVIARVGGRDYQFTTRDISVGGAALVGTLPAATLELPLRLEVPGRRNQYRLKARIVYRQVPGGGDGDGKHEGVGVVGAEFINSTADELRLARTLQRIIAAM